MSDLTSVETNQEANRLADAILRVVFGGGSGKYLPLLLEDAYELGFDTSEMFDALDVFRAEISRLRLFADQNEGDRE